jgi:hypothetical protein
MLIPARYRNSRAAPGFYHHPKTVADLVQHVVGKILDRLGIARVGAQRWTGELEPPREPGVEPRGSGAEGGEA